jgi:RND family efflux transporter MFP subunit
MGGRVTCDAHQSRLTRSIRFSVVTTPAPDLSRLRIQRDEPSPRLSRALRRTLVVFVGAVVLLAALALLLRARSVVPVQTVVVSGGHANAGGTGGGTSVTANGYVVARTRASVSAKVPGRLAFLGVSEGSFVREGEVIARLESADYEAQVAQAAAALASARADLAEAEADRDQLAREARRLRDIRLRNAELVSEQELSLAETRAATAESRVRALTARVDVAEATRRFAQASFENTVIRAPFTGTVLRKEAEVGEVVAPSVGGGLTRGAVVTMADLTTLEVEVDVNEAYISRVSRGQSTRITLDAYPDTAFAGRVRQVVPTADRQRATVQVKVSIEDRDPRILPEMGARVDFMEPARRAVAAPATPAPPRLRVPAAAVREREGRTEVWLVREGRLEPRAVDAGPVSAGFREVRSGLAGGERLLVGGVETPVAGMRVKVVNP